MKPAAIKQGLRVMLESTTETELRDISNEADNERAMLRECRAARLADERLSPGEREALDTEGKLQAIRDDGARAAAARGPLRRDDGLQEFDIDLIGWVAVACTEHSCQDFIQDVFTMPATARRKIDDLLLKIIPGRPGGLEAMDPADRYRLIADLHDEVRRNGGPSSLADAFVLDPDAWRARYVVPGTIRPVV